MSQVRRTLRIDGFIADKLTQYSKQAICSESNIVNVALAQLFAHGYEYIADSVEDYNCVDNPCEYVTELVVF